MFFDTSCGLVLWDAGVDAAKCWGVYWVYLAIHTCGMKWEKKWGKDTEGKKSSWNAGQAAAHCSCEGARWRWPFKGYLTCPLARALYLYLHRTLHRGCLQKTGDWRLPTGLFSAAEQQVLEGSEDRHPCPPQHVPQLQRQVVRLCCGPKLLSNLPVKSKMK